jgi:hypothetical protein
MRRSKPVMREEISTQRDGKFSIGNAIRLKERGIVEVGLETRASAHVLY